MNPIKRILGHLYCIYALTLFAATMLIVVIPIWLTSLLDEPHRARVMHPIFRLWMGVYMPLAFCPVFRKGKEYLWATEPSRVPDIFGRPDARGSRAHPDAFRCSGDFCPPWG